MLTVHWLRVYLYEVIRVFSIFLMKFSSIFVTYINSTISFGYRRTYINSAWVWVEVTGECDIRALHVRLLKCMTNYNNIVQVFVCAMWMSNEYCLHLFLIKLSNAIFDEWLKFFMKLKYKMFSCRVVTKNFFGKVVVSVIERRRENYHSLISSMNWPSRSRASFAGV